MNHDVFISYSTKNAKAAQAICHILEQHEIRCWMAPRDISPGTDYGDVIDDAIKSCKVVVVVFSETAATSQWVKGELNIAFEEQKTIIPFRLDQTPLQGQARVMLNKTHWIDAYPDYQIKFNDLVASVSLAIGKENHPTTQDTPEQVLPGWRKKKYWLAGILFLFFLLGVIFLVPSLLRRLSVFEYHRMDLYTKVKGLSSSQETALTSILDDMVFVEGGAFTMGNDESLSDYFTDQDSLSAHPHQVELTNYYICNSEVTQRQWQAFADLEGHYVERGDDKAVEMVSWEEATAFAKSLSSLTGLNFSLPTEAQWEYAARGGKEWSSNNYLYAGSDDAQRVGWTSVDELTSAHIVKSGKEKNALGLYDMTGNVAEWCLDYFALYDTIKVKNPTGPEEGKDRVLRGGDYRLENLFDLKVTTRFHDAPFAQRKATGLRLVINMK